MFVLSVLAAVGCVAYLAWVLTPPRDAIGSYLPGFGGETRRRRMIQLEDEQDYDLFG
jgi:hypothetical protein